MNQQTMMWRLMWKDIRTIRSLVFAALIGVAAANLLLILIYRMEAGSYRAAEGLIGWSVAFWIMFPNFVALGVPAMLVGNEEESGTSAWLRTLPVRWQQVAAAKMWVAAASVLVTWVVASLMLWLISFLWTSGAYAVMQPPLSLPGIAVIAFYSGSFFLMAFGAVYLIRSPLIALLSLVAVFFPFAIMTAIFVNAMELTDAATVRPGLLLFGVAVLAVLWLCQHLLARRRLLLPIPTIALPATSAAIPPHVQAMPRLRTGAQPTPGISLLWQQLRQTGPICLALICVCTFLAIAFATTHYAMAMTLRVTVLHVLFSIAPVFILLSASWFGALVFYGDNIRRRCAFFADRGISPWCIWWTRMVPPTIGFVVMLVLVGLVGLAIDGEGWNRIVGGYLNFFVVFAVLFAFGQLVSQWAQRPMLAFFAAPAYALVSLTPLFYVVDQFGGDPRVMVLCVPVLLYATWKLTLPWLEGRVQGDFTVRVVAYTAVAVLIPCLCVIGFSAMGRPLRLVDVNRSSEASTPIVEQPAVMPTEITDAGTTP